MHISLDPDFLCHFSLTVNVCNVLYVQRPWVLIPRIATLLCSLRSPTFSASWPEQLTQHTVTHHIRTT